jgi:gamma-glutamylcysteine synthetase
MGGAGGDETGRDLAALRDAAAAVGLELCGYGLDPLRPPRRLLDLPRYAAMERFFDREGPWGRPEGLVSLFRPVALGFLLR